MRFFWVGILLILFAGVSCRNDKKVSQKSPASESVATGTAPSGKLTSPVIGTSSDVKTEAAQAAPKVRIGMKLRFKKLKPEQAKPLAKEFEDQLSVFEPCLPTSGKNEIVRIRAGFELNEKGVIDPVHILEVDPPSPEFENCFLKQIRQLDLGAQTSKVSGEIIVGTFFGQAPDWGVSKGQIRE